MSIETDFRAALVADSAVAAIVGTRVALNGVPQGADVPLVVFIAAHTYDRGLDNTILAHGCTLTVQCWADTGAQAEALGDAVMACAETSGLVVIDRSSGFDPELQLDATLLTIEAWE